MATKDGASYSQSHGAAKHDPLSVGLGKAFDEPNEVLVVLACVTECPLNLRDRESPDHTGITGVREHDHVQCVVVVMHEGAVDALKLVLNTARSTSLAIV